MVYTWNSRFEAAGIMKEKVNELCTLIPGLKKEIDWTKGKTLEGKDYAIYKFKSGSYFDNIAARESSRGKRRHGMPRRHKNRVSSFWSFLFIVNIIIFIVKKRRYSMIGYIYTITNKINNKKYVGMTINYERRKYQHLYELKNNKHHSHKLQRAFNKYGEENFIWEKEIFQVENREQLELLEMKFIKDYDSYNNGYNETFGGDGAKNIFDFETMVALYYICNRYEGIFRHLASFYNCDKSVFSSISKNNLFSQCEPDEKIIEQIINKTKLEEKNLKENYKKHNERKLNKEQCLELLSVILNKKGYDKTMCQIFNITSKLTHRLKNKLIYQEYIIEYEKLSKEQQNKLCEQTFKKYNIEKIKAERNRRSTKNPLTQEQVDYILDNKDNQSQRKIARELNISPDRVSGIVHGKYYKDLIEDYYKRKNAVIKLQN